MNILLIGKCFLCILVNLSLLFFNLFPKAYCHPCKFDKGLKFFLMSFSKQASYCLLAIQLDDLFFMGAHLSQCEIHFIMKIILK